MTSRVEICALDQDLKVITSEYTENKIILDDGTVSVSNTSVGRTRILKAGEIMTVHIGKDDPCLYVVVHEPEIK